MISKTILAALVALPLMTVSTMAQNAPGEHRHHYQGGPTTVVPHQTQSATTSGQSQQTVKKEQTKKSHQYSGGPQTPVPHGQ